MYNLYVGCPHHFREYSLSLCEGLKDAWSAAEDGRKVELRLKTEEPVQQRLNTEVLLYTG